MLAALRRRDHVLRVEVRGCRDVDRVHGAAVAQRFDTGEAVHPCVRAELLDDLRPYISRGGHRDVRMLLHGWQRARGGPAKAHQANTKRWLSHKLPLLTTKGHKG